MSDETIRRAAGIDPDVIREVTRSKRFLAADRAKLDVREIATWDKYLLRERRLLVPVDVQALYAPTDTSEAMVRLPMLVSGPDGQGVENPEDGMPDPFDPGSPRPPGVHLHWAMPDALLRGSVTDRPSGSRNRLTMPVLPDRWVVLRLLCPNASTAVVTTGWVLEADRAVAVPLGSWTEGAALPEGVTPQGEAIDRDDLTGTVGGSVSWSGVYDAVLNRFSFHDPLTDVGVVAADGVDEDCATYVVAGWWSHPVHDPLDSARSKDSLNELLDRLRWRQLYEWGDERWKWKEEQAEFERRQALGLTTEDRWSSARPIQFERPVGDVPRAATRSVGFTPTDSLFVEKAPLIAASAFAVDAATHYVSEPWHLRSTLLHGSVYGVPVAGPVLVDRRPPSSVLSVAIGFHDDDVLAAFASNPGDDVPVRRSTERLMAAFTSQKVNLLGSPDGVTQLEEFEHGAGFTSLPSGSDGNDRYLQRVQTGGAGGLGIGRLGKVPVGAVRDDPFGTKFDARPASPAPRHARPTGGPSDGAGAPSAQRAAAPGLDIVYASNSKPTLIAASELMVNHIARSRVGDVLAPTEVQVVDRPAPRWTMPDDPMVAVRGASRSLRHGRDGRGSADGKLTCRWPTHTITEVGGVIAETRFVASLGNGSIPNEVLAVARESVLYDPYHDDWISRAVTPAGGDRTAIFARLNAETVLRFGSSGVYDGTTAAFDPTVARTPAARRRAAAQPSSLAPGVRQQQMLVGDELHKFSLYHGADPDLVGVTTWAQPWVPMWLEWELAVEGLDPPTVRAWQLGQIDLDPEPAAAADGDAVLLRGRSLLTTGASTTLNSAIVDWLVAEDQLDAVGGGLVDEATEDRYRTLAAAVQHLDVVTAALDGVRTQLLGFEVTDGLRRPTDATGAVVDPAPTTAPRSLWAGAAVLTRARVLDSFGRTLDVPIGAGVRTPTRAAVADRPGALQVPPRLLRPARWNLRLVDAQTDVGTEGVAARIDQVDPTLQVNPVAGFLMPDHLDESLEVFGVDGVPIGELLHESVSGGVMWEIAAGRPGPADAGPLYDLTPSQRPLGRFAAGLVAADAAARRGRPLDPDGSAESALTSLLRAIDTTLWSVDTFAALGSEHVAGLVGRPIAVVRAQLRLELRPPDDIDLSDPDRAAEWAAAEQAAARFAFPIRIGEITRTDDGVLGFFVDDDYSRFRLVDKVIAGVARDSGRSRGQLGVFAAGNRLPPLRPIAHPYIAGTDDADTLELHVGQTVTLTILMHPAGRITLTSGLLPRKALGLGRDWVGAGLAAIAPSLRTGPVLVETDLDLDAQVRLPKVSVFGTDQNFLWRDTPATWRTDAILAATQTALLPDEPAEFREGWIRVAPSPPGASSGAVDGGAP